MSNPSRSKKQTEWPVNPPHDCEFCPRLADFRADIMAREPDWFNGPVPSFGDPQAELLIVGLAPGMQGAHRTGRPFTGDWAGDLLYATIAKFGFSRGVYDARIDDGLVLESYLSLIDVLNDGVAILSYCLFGGHVFFETHGKQYS